MRSKHQLEKWLAKEVLGKDIPRKPPGKARRTQNLRDEDYKAWIRSHPCAACGSRYSIECAHVGLNGGMSMKPSDDCCLPLCSDCHTQAAHAWHRIGRRAFERYHRLDSLARARELRAEWLAKKDAKSA